MKVLLAGLLLLGGLVYACEYADLNGNGKVELQDIVIAVKAYGTPDPVADVNKDGVVDMKDIIMVVHCFGKYLY
jgi:hypothetical protein